MLNGDTTFAESQTETFFTLPIKHRLVYVEKYTPNSITLKITFVARKATIFLLSPYLKRSKI